MPSAEIFVRSSLHLIFAIISVTKWPKPSITIGVILWRKLITYVQCNSKFAKQNSFHLISKDLKNILIKNFRNKKYRIKRQSLLKYLHWMMFISNLIISRMLRLIVENQPVVVIVQWRTISKLNPDIMAHPILIAIYLREHF